MTDRQSIILFCVCHGYCVRAPALPNGGGRRKVAGGMLYLCLEELDDIGSSHSLGRCPSPAPLDHVPHAVRDLRMKRPRWPLVLDHREDYCGLLYLAGERWFSGEDLGPEPAGEHLKIRRHAGAQLTSQASIPKANTSVALVVRAWGSPNACGLTSSGAIP